jgi:hypothetical protein
VKRLGIFKYLLSTLACLKLLDCFCECTGSMNLKESGPIAKVSYQFPKSKIYKIRFFNRIHWSSNLFA